MRIALNAAIDTRRRDRDRPFTGEVADPRPVRADRDPDLEHALLALPPRRRLMVFLRYFADLSYADIAAVTGTSEGTVAATLNQAHQQTVVAALGQFALQSSDLSALLEHTVLFIAQTLEVEYFGIDSPPLHTHCVCQVIPILLEAQ